MYGSFRIKRGCYDVAPGELCLSSPETEKGSTRQTQFQVLGAVTKVSAQQYVLLVHFQGHPGTTIAH